MASNPDSESVSPSTSTSKISIPRLSIREVAAGPRTRKACKECRIRKAKCDGHQPCSRCAACGVECLYIDGKRETMERCVRIHDALRNYSDRQGSGDTKILKVGFRRTRKSCAGYSFESSPRKGTLSLRLLPMYATIWLTVYKLWPLLTYVLVRSVY